MLLSSGLINYLKTHFPAMFRMYCILKDRAKPPTPEEVAIASAKQVLDAKSESEYIQRLETSTENI